jgi:hypothetical protein
MNIKQDRQDQLEELVKNKLKQFIQGHPAYILRFLPINDGERDHLIIDIMDNEKDEDYCEHCGEKIEDCSVVIDVKRKR